MLSPNIIHLYLVRPSEVLGVNAEILTILCAPMKTNWEYDVHVCECKKSTSSISVSGRLMTTNDAKDPFSARSWRKPGTGGKSK